ncbi:MAG: accessory gene regulator B family protein [Lachnospiraceae bacterium]|nr:accessory gene regulator B family protein [Lachnospiraceae bacterium]MCM1231479.1 accessory gene regulator B family protein [Ruminococcus flavefaciens]
MISKISTLISNQLVKHKIISEDAQDVYKYGVEIIVSSFIGFVIVTLVGIIFKALLQAMIFYVIFVALRSMTGGYHASTYLKCNTVFSLISLFTIFFSKASSEIQLSVEMITLFFLPAVAIFLWLAPVENSNKPIEEKKRIYWKLTAVIISVLLYILSILLYINQHIFESAVVTMTVFMVSILCMIPFFQKGGKN